MSSNPYQTPASKVAEELKSSAKVPLSRALGKKKLLIGIPTSVICGFLAYIGVFSGITQMLAVILAAYAMVGLVEVVGGDSLIASAKKWDTLPGWKKFIISLIVIVISIAVFFSLIPIVSNFL